MPAESPSLSQYLGSNPTSAWASVSRGVDEDSRGVSRFGDSLSLIQVDGNTELSPVGAGTSPFLTGLEKQPQGQACPPVVQPTV